MLCIIDPPKYLIKSGSFVLKLSDLLHFPRDKEAGSDEMHFKISIQCNKSTRPCLLQRDEKGEFNLTKIQLRDSDSRRRRSEKKPSTK